MMGIEQDIYSAIACYRELKDDLQGRVFYTEDEEGVLRRWHPPRIPVSDPLDDVFRSVEIYEQIKDLIDKENE